MVGFRTNGGLNQDLLCTKPPLNDNYGVIQYPKEQRNPIQNAYKIV